MIVKYEFYINLYKLYDDVFGLGRFGGFLCQFAVKHVILNGRMSALFICTLLTLSVCV